MIKKTWHDINEKIKQGKAVVLTAEEVKEMAQTASPAEIAAKVDVVTTGTFSPMCSSGVFMNFGHSTPPIKMETIHLNGVPAYGGLAAVDTYLGATAVNPADKTYGGAHVMEALIRGEDIELKASGKGTDCYPRKRITTYINKKTINDMILFNPRNAYQNYNVAVNSSSKTLHTYMGTLLPNMGNANYATAGELSPLLNCPDMGVVGVGSCIFLGGTEGYIAWPGTQGNSKIEVNHAGIPRGPGRTLALVGDMKIMTARWLKAAYYYGYGVSLFVGVGIPIPILCEDIARAVSIRNKDIETKVLDFGRKKSYLQTVNYTELQSGAINLQGKRVRTAPLSSLFKARQIALELKRWLLQGSFFLNQPVTPWPQQINRPLKRRNMPPHIKSDSPPRTDQCVHCGACMAVCEQGALSIDPATKQLVYQPQNCNKCMACSQACPLQLIV